MASRRDGGAVVSPLLLLLLLLPLLWGPSLKNLEQLLEGMSGNYDDRSDSHLSGLKKNDEEGMRVRSRSVLSLLKTLSKMLMIPSSQL